MPRKKRDPLEIYFPSGVSFQKDFVDFFGTKKRRKKKDLFDL